MIRSPNSFRNDSRQGVFHGYTIDILICIRSQLSPDPNCPTQVFVLFVLANPLITGRSSLDHKLRSLQKCEGFTASVFDGVCCHFIYRDVLELKETVKIIDGESEAYISEIETIGQAYEDIQTQNQQLLQQVAERDDYNMKAKPFSRRLICSVAAVHLPKQVEESKMDMPKEIFLKEYKISPIQSLIGLTGRRWVMGVISQEDGHFYLHY
ncbi:hypothetical protein ACSBR1_003497 [Camellia fascicularis]